MNRILYRLGTGAATHPWRTISAWVVVVAFGLAETSASERLRGPGSQGGRW